MDSSRRIVQELSDEWDQVSAYWEAEAKEQYKKKIFDPIVEQAEAMNELNARLKEFSDDCIRATE